MSSTSSTDAGPVETIIRSKLTDALSPISIDIVNDSWKHRHHKAMMEQGGGAETHFSVSIVSEAFRGKILMQRHRMIYKVLSDELAQQVHALSLSTKTPDEVPAQL